MRTALCTLAACLSTFAMNGAEAIYHLQDGFSTNENPSGVWTYGATPGSEWRFERMTNNVNGFWNHGTYDFRGTTMYIPGITLESGENTNGYYANIPPEFILPGIQLVNSMNSFHVPVLRFTAPTGGQYRIAIRVIPDVDMNLRLFLNEQEITMERVGLLHVYTNVLHLSPGNTLDIEGAREMPDITVRRVRVLAQGFLELVAADDTPRALSFIPPGGFFTNLLQVTILNHLSNSTVRFTRDGGLPTLQSSEASTPLILTNHTTVLAAVFSNQVQISEVYTSTYQRVYAINDGIPASWREQYFGDNYLTDPRVAANADPDVDGSTNLEEFQAGSNPLDPASGFKAQIEIVPLLRFPTVPSRVYDIQRKSSLTGNFSTIATITATNAITVFVDLQPEAESFYTISLRP